MFWSADLIHNFTHLNIWNKFLIYENIVSLIQTLTGHSGNVLSLKVLQNGNLASGSNDKTIKIWDSTSGALIQTFSGTGNFWELLVLQNGNLVAGAFNSTIKILNQATGSLIKTIYSSYFWALTLLQNGNLAAGSSDSTIKIWDLTTGTLIQTLTGHLGSVYGLSLLQNGNLVSGSFDTTIKIPRMVYLSGCQLIDLPYVVALFQFIWCVPDTVSTRHRFDRWNTFLWAQHGISQTAAGHRCIGPTAQDRARGCPPWLRKLLR